MEAHAAERAHAAGEFEEFSGDPLWMTLGSLQFAPPCREVTKGNATEVKCDEGQRVLVCRFEREVIESIREKYEKHRRCLRNPDAFGCGSYVPRAYENFLRSLRQRSQRALLECTVEVLSLRRPLWGIVPASPEAVLRASGKYLLGKGSSAVGGGMSVGGFMGVPLLSGVGAALLESSVCAAKSAKVRGGILEPLDEYRYHRCIAEALDSAGGVGGVMRWLQLFFPSSTSTARHKE